MSGEPRCHFHRSELLPSEDRGGAAFGAGAGALSLIHNIFLRKQACLLMTALCLGLAYVLVACHSDRRESFYPSLTDAKKDGANDRGWLPDFLPESSRAIHEVHDISPSTTWCAFEFLPNDSDTLRKRLETAGIPALRVRRVLNPGMAWWPALFQGNIDLDKIRRAGFELYMVEEPETPSSTVDLLFAIDWQKGQGYFYRRRE